MCQNFYASYMQQCGVFICDICKVAVGTMYSQCICAMGSHGNIPSVSVACSIGAPAPPDLPWTRAQLKEL